MKHNLENTSQALFLVRELIGYQSLSQTLEDNEITWLEYIKENLEMNGRYFCERIVREESSL